MDWGLCDLHVSARTLTVDDLGIDIATSPNFHMALPANALLHLLSTRRAMLLIVLLSQYVCNTYSESAKSVAAIRCIGMRLDSKCEFAEALARVF